VKEVAAISRKGFAPGYKTDNQDSNMAVCSFLHGDHALFGVMGACHITLAHGSMPWWPFATGCSMGAAHADVLPQAFHVACGMLVACL
jgi:hypothetical protein